MIFLVALLFSDPAIGRKDPDTGRIRVLYIGDHGPYSPSPIMDSEPLIQLRVAVAVFHLKGPERRRLNRLYFPRTYADLTQYEAIVISDAPVDQFEDRHYVWFKNSVIQNGSGFVMIGGNGGFGGGPEMPWNPTAVQDVLPVWGVVGEKAIGRVEIADPDHEFVEGLPLTKRWDWMHEYGINEVVLKQEAYMLAEVQDRGKGSIPFWATWDLGKGRSFAVTGDWTPMGGVLFMRWPYYGDFALNLMLYLSQNPIPGNLELLHRLRADFFGYRSTRTYLFSVMEFAEKFGANMESVEAMLTEADEKQLESARAYLDQDFDGSMEWISEALDHLLQASDRAMRLKDEALVWIYLIEWSVVTATFTIGAFVLWTLMVRRRLYREVERTRFAI